MTCEHSSQLLPDKISLGILSVEQAGEVFYTFPIEPGLSLPLSLHPAFRQFTVIVVDKRVEKRVLGWDISLLKDKSKSKDTAPAAGSIMLSLHLLLVRRKVNLMVEVVSHVPPEVVVDSLFLLNSIKSGLSLTCE